MTFVRARQPEQKEERRVQLLATARLLLEEVPLQALSLNELARRAAMTKSNVYRYFESREAVLLELLKDEWLAWGVTLTTTWAPPPPSTTPSTPTTNLLHLTRHMAHTLAARPLLCMLTSALPSVLEQNVSEGAIVDFKRLTLAFFEDTAAFMSRAVPDLGPAAALQLMQDGAVVLTGLWPHAHPATAVQRAMQSAPELAAFRWDFEGDLQRLLFAVAVAAMEPRSG